MALKFSIAMALVALVFLGCNLIISSGCLCTTEFVGVGFSLVDVSGRPISDVAVRVTIGPTGKPLGLDQPRASDGFYIVITDLEKDLLDPSGEVIHVFGSHGGHSFEAEFVVEVPGDCRCHVRKVSGPGQVVLE